jgi:hypothetical protein
MMKESQNMLRRLKGGASRQKDVYIFKQKCITNMASTMELIQKCVLWPRLPLLVHYANSLRAFAAF